MKFWAVVCIIIALEGFHYWDKVTHLWAPVNNTAEIHRAEDTVEDANEKYSTAYDKARQDYKDGKITLAVRDARIDASATLRKQELAAAKKHSGEVPPPPPPTTWDQVPGGPTGFRIIKSPSGVRLATPVASVAKLDDSRWRITLPANEVFHTGVQLTPGQSVKITDCSGQLKLGVEEAYASPCDGSTPTSEVGLSSQDVWTMPQAWVGALLAKLSSGAPNSELINAGGQQGTVFPVPADGEELTVFVNCLFSQRPRASGGYVFTVEVQ